MRHSSIIWIIGILLFVSSCLTDVEPPKNEPEVPTISYDELTRTAVTLKGHYTDNGSITEYGFEQANGGTDNWVVISKNPPKDASNDFTFRVEDLTYGTTYYFRTYIASGNTKKYTRAQDITTRSKSEATLSEVTYEQDLMKAVIRDDGGRNITSVGFLGGESSDVKELQNKGRDVKGLLGKDGSSFTARISSFEPGKTYYFIAYAENSDEGTRQVGYSRSATSVSVTEDFPVDVEDGVFADYLVAYYDTNRDGRMSYAEMKAIKEIRVSTDSITSLVGIEWMPALQVLVCCGSSAGAGKLDNLDISHNPALTTLRCDNNGIRSLDVSGNVHLDTLSCSGNRLSELSILANSSLVYLDCSANQISKLSDLSVNEGLKHLNISGNPINIIDISPCVGLQEFNATSCPVLRIIYVWPDFFSESDHSGFQKDGTAEYVISPNAPIVFADARFKAYCVASFDANGDGEVSVSEAAMATRMEVCTDEIGSLKGVGFFTSLKSLSCYGNEAATKTIASYTGRLTSLDVTSLVALDSLDCHGNQIKALDVSQNKDLSYLDCSGNLISTIDLSHNLKLADFNCRQNQLSNIVLSGNAVLGRLNCADNKLITLDVSRNVYLADLDCSNNQIPSLDVTGNKDLKRLVCSGNMLKVLDVSENRSLEELDCSGNPLETLYLFANQVIPTMKIPESAAVSYCISSITIQPDSVSLQEGETATLTAVIEPADAIDKTVTWTSSDEKIASVSGSGVVQAIKVGKSTITAACGGKKATCQVEVIPVPVSEVKLDSTHLEIRIGSTKTLHATVLPENATDKTVAWTSSDENIAKVSKEGEITAVGLGTCIVTAKAGEKSATCEVVVQPIPVESVAISKHELELFIGSKDTLSAKVSPENATFPEVTWTSSDESIASVSRDGVVSAIKLGSCTITATAGEKQDVCQVTVKPIPVSSISIKPTSCKMYVGGTQVLQVTVLPENATDKTVTWSSDDTSVAKVSDGTITAVGLGTCTITARAGEKSANCQVEVENNFVPVTSISLDQTSMTLVVGDSGTLTATVLPTDASNPAVSWSSDDTSVATVSDGTVNAISVGTCTITATAGNRSATCYVTVRSSTVPVTSVTLNTSSLSLSVGQSSTLTATVLPSDATDKTVSWSSSSAAVATVSSSGVVTAVAAGSCTITAAAGGKSATCAVTVISSTKEVESVSINARSLALAIGESWTLTATVLPEDATDKSVSWSSSDVSVATISSSGEVTAISNGSCTVTATAGAKSASCKVSVGIPITTTYFPDEGFRKYVYSNFDKNADHVLSEDEINEVTHINIWSPYGHSTIASLKGIEYFNRIEYLWCGNSDITSLDLSHNLALTVVYCYQCKLKSLDISNNAALEVLECYANEIGSLDLSNTPSLKTLDCSGNNLSQLDVSGCKVISRLLCDSNQISGLDLSHKELLSYLSCGYNKLTYLNVDGCGALEHILCWENQLTILDVSSCLALTYLMCINNPLSEIWLKTGQSIASFTYPSNTSIKFKE